MSKRVLWLIQRREIMESDIPEIVSFGYEVYTVKKASWSNRTDGSLLTDNYDDTLSLDADFKSELDRQDFLSPIPDALWSKINDCFDLAFIDYIPEQLEQFLDHYKGKLILRLCSTPAAGSLGKQMVEDFGISVFQKLDRMLSRFWFAPVYAPEKNREAQIIERSYVSLPFSLDLSETAPAFSTGSASKSVCLICPEIKIREEQEELYKDALEIFAHNSKRKLEYTVCGNQYVSCDFDPSIQGALSEQDLSSLLRSSACALCLQPRWGIADHYIWAVLRAGIPLLVPESSEIGRFLRKNGASAGVFRDPAEAFRMLQGLTSDGAALRNKIVSQQRELLRSCFDRQCNHKGYMLELDHIQSANMFQTHQVLEKPRLGVVLLDAYSSFTMLQIRSFLHSLLDGAKGRFSLCFGYPKDASFARHMKEIHDIEELGIPVRPFTFEVKDQRWMDDMLQMKGYPKFAPTPPFHVLNDDNTMFEDCSALFFFCNKAISSLLPASRIITSVPFGIYVTDYDDASGIRSSVPYLNALSLQRSASLVLFPDEKTRERGLYLDGIRPERTKVFRPLFAKPVSDRTEGLPAEKSPYFLFICPSFTEEIVQWTKQILSEFYLRGGKEDVILAEVSASGGFRVFRRTADWYLAPIHASATRSKDDSGSGSVLEPFSGLSLGIASFCSLIRRARYAVLPEYTDMHSQLAFWLLSSGVPFACRRSSCISFLSDISAHPIHFLEDSEPETVCLQLLSLEETASSPDPVGTLLEQHSPGAEELADILIRSLCLS